MHIDLKYYKKGIAKIPEGKKIGVIGLQGSGNDQFIKKIEEVVASATSS